MQSETNSPVQNELHQSTIPHDKQWMVDL